MMPVDLKHMNGKYNFIWKYYTYNKEKPLKLLAISLGISNRVVRELVLLVKVLGKINKDSRSFEDGESFVSDCGDASIRVDFQEPR